MLKTKLTNEEAIQPPPIPNKPRLTMKILFTLIEELQHRDQILTERVERFEKQINEFNQSRDEVAAVDEQLHNHEVILSQDIQSQEIRVSRAKRHTSPRKNPFGFWR
jgi:DNA-binding protein H-NS